MIKRKQLPIEELAVDIVQSREQAWAGDQEDQQLAASVDNVGLLQDILVRPIEQAELNNINEDTEDADYLIVAGSRRYYAAMQAGYETVPCKIIAEDDHEAAWISLLENIDRRELSEQEIADQLQLLYELVRPIEEPEHCPQCGTSVEGEEGLTAHYAASDCDPIDVTSADVQLDQTADRLHTDQQARRYLAWRYLGRTDQSAVSIIDSHLRTAQLPPVLQTLFKSPDERSEQEKMTLQNYGIDTKITLGSGGGRSKASQVIASIHDTVTEQFDTDDVDPTDAVLEAVGRLRREDLSEKEFEREMRQFRRDLIAEVETASKNYREVFEDVLNTHATELREAKEDLAPSQPFKRVDVRASDEERYNRWYAQEHARRDVRSHGQLIQQLYEERLETIAEERGWI